MKSVAEQQHASGIVRHPSLYHAPTSTTRQRTAVFSIMYHDVIEKGDYDASGFPGAHARIYKLEKSAFELHLEAINRARSVRRCEGWHDDRLLLTFDDGGVSALNQIAPLLERNGWRGHFFVATDWIGRPGFLTADQIRDLDRRGHLIGSHSCSHPDRITHVPHDRLVLEWQASALRLADLVGHPVTAASVPGGYYSQAVAEAAADAGIEVLFTSKPTAAVEVVGGCYVLGRYTIQRWMGPEWSGGLAMGQWSPRFKQLLAWKVKRVLKSVGGGMYIRAQKNLFSKVAE